MIAPLFPMRVRDLFVFGACSVSAPIPLLLYSLYLTLDCGRAY